MAIKPILFNTEMVRAILDGRKTCTRRAVKHNVEAVLNSPYHMEHPEVEDAWLIKKLCRPPYEPGDILYVRETWGEGYAEGTYIYKADDKLAERLQDMTDDDAEAEGCFDYTSTALGFPDVWDSTIKKSDRDRYGWEANPWVWVIEFERCEKPEEVRS